MRLMNGWMNGWMTYFKQHEEKNNACTDFCNVNITLKLHSSEENLSFKLKFIKKMYLLLLFSPFLANAHLTPPENTLISGGIEWENWPEMV